MAIRYHQWPSQREVTSDNPRSVTQFIRGNQRSISGCGPDEDLSSVREAAVLAANWSRRAANELLKSCCACGKLVTESC